MYSPALYISQINDMLEIESSYVYNINSGTLLTNDSEILENKYIDTSPC